MNLIKKATAISFLLIILLTTLAAQNVSFANGNSPTEYIYVDPINGNDNNPGRLDLPVNTIPTAQRIVREKIQSGISNNIVVFLRHGYHQVSTPIQFSNADGSNNINITYAGYPGERAVISGHKVLPAQWESLGNNTWKLNYSGISLPEWTFSNLYFNGEIREQSRYPAQGYLRITDTNNNLRKIKFNVDLPQFTSLSTHAVFLNDWATSRSLITGVRIDSRRDIALATPAGFADHPYNKAKEGGYGYFTNVPMELASPKTWSYDDVNKILYYKAKDGENPNNLNVLTPSAPQLINIDGGSKSTPVENIRFVGLEFEFSNGWFFPEDGYRGFQAGTFNTPADGYARYRDFRSAIKIQNASNIQFNNNRVGHVTGNGIHIGTGTQKIKLLDNVFENIGVNCIRVGDTYDMQDGHANNVVVKGNLVRRCGDIVPDAVGIWEGYSRKVSISSNTVSNLPYTGISMGWRWDGTPTSQRNNKINGNRIFNVMNKLADGGGIYTLGINPNTSITGNLIYNVKRSPYASGSENNAIFFDQYTTGITVTNNAAYNIDAAQQFRYNLTSPERNYVSNNYFGNIAQTVNLSAGTKLGVGTSFSKFQLGIISATATGNDLQVSWGNVSGAESYEVILSKYSTVRNLYTQTLKKQSKNTSINIADLKPGRYSIEIRFKINGVLSRNSDPVFYTLERTSTTLNATEDAFVNPELVEEEDLGE